MACISGDACKDNLSLRVDKEVKFPVVGKPEDAETFCAWLFAAETGKKMQLNMETFNFKYASDFLSIIDSGKFCP